MTGTHLDPRGGKKLKKMLEEYFGNPNYEDILRLCRISHYALTGTFNEHARAEFQKYVESMPSIHPIIFHRELFDDFDMPTSILGAMMPYTDMNRPDQQNIYLPIYMNDYFTELMYIKEVVKWPMSIGAEHTAPRYIRRSCEILDVGSNAFRSSMQIALVMAIAHDHTVRNGDLKPRVMIVPNKHGAFVGNIEPMPPTMFSRLVIGVGNNNGEDFLDAGFASSDRQPFVPDSLVNIRTFYDHSMCTGVIERLYDRIHNIWHDPLHARGIETIIRTYTTEVMQFHDQSDLASAQRVIEKMKDVYRSADWQKLSERAIRNGHLPEKSRAELYAERQTQARPPQQSPDNPGP